jgi:glycosyltransferase involved in cell wall biosynthesis
MNEASLSSAPISLIIPTYNREALISETIECALNQHLPFDEIIVIDDGSTDNTQTVLSRYSNRVNLIRIENAGVQFARNLGVKRARNDIVAFCDSDDLLNQEFTTLVSRHIQKHPETDVIYVNFVTFDAVTTHPDKYTQAPEGYFEHASNDDGFLINIPDLYRKSLQFQPFFVSGLTIKKSHFEQIGGYNTAFRHIGAEDWEFTLRAIENGRVAFSTPPLARVRRHAGNDSGDLLRMNLGEADILQHALAAHTKARELEKELTHTINERLIMAFDIAYAAGQFQTARQIAPRIKTPAIPAKFWLKRLISALPTPLRQALWRLTQSIQPHQ